MMKNHCEVCGIISRTKQLISYKGKFRCRRCFLKRCHRLPLFETDLFKKMLSVEKRREQKKKYNKEYRKNNRLKLNKYFRDYQRKKNNSPPERWKVKE